MVECLNWDIGPKTCSIIISFKLHLGSILLASKMEDLNNVCVTGFIGML